MHAIRRWLSLEDVQAKCAHRAAALRTDGRLDLPAHRWGTLTSAWRLRSPSGRWAAPQEQGQLSSSSALGLAGGHACMCLSTSWLYLNT